MSLGGFPNDVIDASIKTVDDMFGVRLSRLQFVTALFALSFFSYFQSHRLPVLQNVVFSASDYVVVSSVFFCVYLLLNRKRLHGVTVLFTLIGASAGNIKPLRSNFLFASIAAIASLLKV